MKLIDADELMEHAWRDKLDSRELIAEMIAKAPTIKEIPTKIPIGIFEKLVSQESILDKIREDVNKLFVPLCDGSEEWRSYVNETLLDVLEIINKYKVESEVEK